MDINFGLDKSKSFLPHTLVGGLLFFAFFVRQYGFIRTMIGTVIGYLLIVAAIYGMFGPVAAVKTLLFTYAFPATIVMSFVDKSWGTTYTDTIVYQMHWICNQLEVICT